MNLVPSQPLERIPPPRRGDLQTLAGVKLEMARVYRRMKTGKIKTQDGTRLAYVLTCVAKLIETSELQARLEAIEATLGSESKR